jgi:hypothetical protein
MVSSSGSIHFALIMTQLPKGVENSISMGFVMMCSDKNPEATPTLFCHYLCPALRHPKVRLAVDGDQGLLTT